MGTRHVWHKHYHELALNGMKNLSVDLRGVYYTLLDLMYERMLPLAESDQMMAARMCCSVRKWKSYRDELIRLGKIEWSADGKLTNNRFENELKKLRESSESKSAAGRASGESRRKAKEIRENHEQAFNSGTNRRKEEEKKTKKKVPASAGGLFDDNVVELPADNTRILAAFEDAWKLYQSCDLRANAVKAKSKEMWLKVTRTVAPDVVIAALQQEVDLRKNGATTYKGVFHGTLKAFQRWLRDTDFTDVDVPETKPKDIWQERFQSFVNGEWETTWGPSPDQPGTKMPPQWVERCYDLMMDDADPATVAGLLKNLRRAAG